MTAEYAPTRRDHGHHDHESAPLREVLHERLIQLGTMRVELRLIVGVAIAQLIVAAILLGLKEADGGPFTPSVYAFPADTGNGLQLISEAAFVIGLLIVSAAWAYALAGAMRAGVVVRVLVLGAFAWAFLSERDALVGVDLSATVACLVLLSLIAVLMVVTYLPERRLHGTRLAGGPENLGSWRWVRRAQVPLLFLLVGSVYLAAWVASSSADAVNGPPSDGLTNVQAFSNDVFNQVDNLQYLLIPLLVLAGSDFGEWSQLVVSRVTRRLRSGTSAWTFAVIAGLAGAAVAFDGLTVANGPDGGGIGGELILGAVVGAVAATLYLLARPRGGWGTGVPFAAIALVAILDTVSGFVTQLLQANSGHLNDDIQLASAALWVAGGVVSLVLLAALRGRLSPAVTAGLVFVVLIGAIDLLGSIWVLGNFDNAPLGITADNAPYLGPEGLRAVAGIVTVVVVVAAVVCGRLRQWAVPISLALVAAVTLEALSFIDLLYANKGKLEEVPPVGGLAIGGTIILLAALLWDLAVSGEAITNVQGRHFPRDTRVLLFVGYILMVSSAVLLFASLHDQGGKLLESSFDPEAWVKQGILFLGMPLVIALGIVGIHRWREQRATEHPGSDTAEVVHPA